MSDILLVILAFAAGFLFVILGFAAGWYASRFYEERKFWKAMSDVQAARDPEQKKSIGIIVGVQQRLDECRSQLRAILIRDFNYDHEPTYGWTPMRHQFAWRMAMHGLTPDEIALKVEEGRAAEEAERDPTPLSDVQTAARGETVTKDQRFKS